MVILAALVVMVPLSAFARPKNERKVTITDTVQVGTTQLKAGIYKVEWSGTGPQLNVSFLKNNKTIATAQGKMLEKNEKATRDTVVLKTMGNTKRLEEIDFGGRKNALVFSSDQTAMK
jgi:hypothetical protein